MLITDIKLNKQALQRTGPQPIELKTARGG